MTAQTLFSQPFPASTDYLVADDLTLNSGAEISNAVRSILLEIGEDPGREGLLKTPERVSRMFEEITSGYQTDPVQLVNGALFEVDYNEWQLFRVCRRGEPDFNDCSPDAACGRPIPPAIGRHTLGKTRGDFNPMTYRCDPFPTKEEGNDLLAKVSIPR